MSNKRLRGASSALASPGPTKHKAKLDKRPQARHRHRSFINTLHELRLDRHFNPVVFIARKFRLNLFIAYPSAGPMLSWLHPGKMSSGIC